MAYPYYIKDFEKKQLILYFDGVPPYAIRAQLKSNGWLWNSHEFYWYASLTQQHENLAKGIGATDVTAPDSNPAIAADEMDIQNIRNSMVTIFKNPVFATHSLRQIQDYLDSLSGGSPLQVNVDTHGIALAGIALIDPVHFKMETVMIAGESARADENNRIYSEDSPFAQNLLRCVSFHRPYLLYKSAVYGIAGVSDNSYLRRLISHTRNLNSSESYVDVWVYRLKKPCQHRGVQSVTAFVPSECSPVEQQINVAFCPVCQKYYINADQYRSFTKQFGLPYIRLRSDSAPDFSTRQEESLLHYMGYNVNTTDNLSASARHAILEHAIDTGAMTKIQVISFLEFLIHQGECNPRFVNACEKWRADVQHIRNYRLQEQKYVRGRLLLRC